MIKVGGQETWETTHGAWYINRNGIFGEWLENGSSVIGETNADYGMIGKENH